MFHQPKRLILILTLLAVAAGSTPVRAALQKYIARPEPAFGWKLREVMETGNRDRVYDLQFVSQTWRDAPWEHRLQIYQPAGVPPASKLFLWITGGSPSPLHASFGLELARKSGGPVAFLYEIPNQPLLEAKLYEDDLIAETFVRYLKTGEEEWPLLFPMVKSVVKAMDVLQAFSSEQWGDRVDGFILSGASKRGWTAWLTAAADRRVRAVAPVVIDVLNMREQMSRQLETLGGYSTRLEPYTSRGLLPIPDTAEGRRLLDMVDPWAYRDRLTLPKLMINGTNDFYWATGALNLYWNQLPGDKWAIYVPNAGHNLIRRDEPAGPFSHLINGLAAFSRHQRNGKAMPKLAWKHETTAGKLRLTVEATPAPTAARLWVARSRTQDFRNVAWEEQAAAVSKGVVTGEVEPPEEGYLAFFGELDYEVDGLPYRLSTQLRMAGSSK